MTATNLEQAARELAEAVAAGNAARSRDARLRPARQVLISRCSDALGTEVASVPSAIKRAVEAPSRTARRTCAVLLVHALAVPGLVPMASAADVCALAEGALRDVLLRCGYPFGGSTGDKLRVLERLHASINELMQPLEPTFPNWQGLYAG